MRKEDAPRPPRRCIGFGDTEGQCENVAGTPWSDYWCATCDDKRRAEIQRELEETR